MSNSSTPYDDAFRTLLTDCSRLIIPLVNVMFDSSYSIDDARSYGDYGRTSVRL